MVRQCVASRRRRAVALALGVVLLSGTVAAVPAAADQPRPASNPTSTPELVVRDGAGRVRLVAARPGRTLAAAPAGLTGVAAARAQLRPYARAFGLGSLAGLRATEGARAPSGHRVVRFQQHVDGVPVLAGQLIAVLDRGSGLVSVSGEVSAAAGTPAYAVAASTAARTAVRSTARRHGLRAGELLAGRPTRLLYDASLVDPRGRPGARSVWRVEVTGRDRPDVADLVLVDATTGRVALGMDTVAGALDRVVCDRAGTRSTDEVCRPGQYARVEGQGPTGVTDIDQAFDLTGATADWYAARLGVDLTALIGSDRGDGRKLRSTTRYCGPEGCPLENAFWTGDQMVYGAGFTSADDVVAHELTHGVTQAAAGLIYWFQSGAINESMSDVFGELVDLGNGVGNDAPEVRWVLGEDLTTAAGGVARDMADPPAYGQPDSTGSDLYDFAPDYDDNGAVHTDSGVPNKTAYLVADGTAGEPGGAFNGHAFAGIGLDKTALVYWHALQLLTPGADFADLAAVLAQACANLASTGTAGFVTADCDTIAAATAATGLTRWAGPTAPRDVRLRAGTRSVEVVWRAPASSGSSPLSSYAVWVHPAVADEDFIALEPSARSNLVEGLTPGVDYTIGVVAVTADGTSPSVSRRFRGSAVRVSWPTSVVFGDGLPLSVVLVGAGEVPYAGRTVRLLRRFPGEAGLDEVDEGTTGADGSVTLRTRPQRGAAYVLTVAPHGSVLGVRTSEHQVLVRPRVSLVTDPSLRRVEVPRFRGLVTPALPGATVRLQRRSTDGIWRTQVRGRLDGRGRYDLSVAGPARTAEWRIRVSAPRRSGLAAGLSRTVLVTVATS